MFNLRFGLTGVIALLGGYYLTLQQLNKLAPTVRMTYPNVAVIPVSLEMRKQAGLPGTNKTFNYVLWYIIGSLIGFWMVKTVLSQKSIFSVTFPFFISWSLFIVGSVPLLYFTNYKLTEFLHKTGKLPITWSFVDKKALTKYSLWMLLHAGFSFSFGVYGLLTHGFLFKIGAFKI